MSSQISNTRTLLNQLASVIATGQERESKNEWGGADVVITNVPPKTPSDQSFYPDPRRVITPNSKYLSWLFFELKDAFRELIDGTTKIEFYGRLANTAQRYQKRCNTVEVRRDLLLAVLHEANAILDELEEGSFQFLSAALGNNIADDFIEREEKRGFIGVEETRKFFESKGVDLP